MRHCAQCFLQSLQCINTAVLKFAVTAVAVGNHGCKRQLTSVAIVLDSLAAHDMSEAQAYFC